MNPVVARYLAEKAEPEATFANRFEGSFGHAIEVPAYGETGDLFATLESIPEGPLGEVLTVVVLNARADSSPEVHEANRLARQKIVAESSTAHVLSEAPDVRLLTRPRGKVLLIDRAAPGHFLPTGQGIGLARKIGCDLIAALHQQGQLASSWIHATDADVRLPGDYFEQIGAVDSQTACAALYSFEHRFPEDEDLANAGKLHEISLRYMTLGLAWAGSPYAYQSLGSCLAIAPWAYGAVGGFPRRNSIEDFTVLNDLAKVGSIERLSGSPIELEGRVSTRVPISTGQTLAKLVQTRESGAGFELHHPIVFAHLAAWLRVLGALARSRGNLDSALRELPHGNPFFRADLLEQALGDMGAFESIREAMGEPADEETLLRRFHAGFDAFATRKLLDDLRDVGFPSIGFREALSEAPFTGLIASTEDDLETLRFLLADEEKKLSVVPAGVPALELDRA